MTQIRAAAPSAISPTCEPRVGGQITRAVAGHEGDGREGRAQREAAEQVGMAAHRLRNGTYGV